MEVTFISFQTVHATQKTMVRCVVMTSLEVATRALRELKDIPVLALRCSSSTLQPSSGGTTQKPPRVNPWHFKVLTYNLQECCGVQCLVQIHQDTQAGKVEIKPTISWSTALPLPLHAPHKVLLIHSSADTEVVEHLHLLPHPQTLQVQGFAQEPFNV